MENFNQKLISESSSYNFNKPDFLHIAFLRQGKALITMEQKERAFEPNKIFMILPDCELEITTEIESEVVVISFGIELIQMEGKVFALDIFRLFVSHYKEPRTSVDEEALKKIDHISTLISEEINLQKPSDLIIWSYFKIILLELLRNKSVHLSKADKNIERIQDFFNLVHNHAAKEKRISFYAEKLNISPKRLNQILQELTNKSISYFLHEHLILEAKKLLVSGNYSVGEIAFKLGFEDQAYFSRFFKKWTSFSPENFKQNYLKNREELLYKNGLLNYYIAN